MHSNRGNCEVSNRIYDYGLVKRKYIENVVFENFVFTDSTFAEIKISKCTFKNCKFIRCHYYDSPIHNNKFVDCYFEDVTLYNNLDVKGNFFERATGGIKYFWACKFNSNIFKDMDFTCFSKANTAAFRFRIYAVSDHVWSGPVETIAATCETAGIAQDACILCGKTEPVEVPALGHALQKTEAVQPTATSGGNIEYWTCTRCGAQFTDAEGTQKVEDPAALILPPDNSCPLCGRTHERSAFDKWIGRIHKVLYWIRSLFQKIFGINKSAVYAP